MTTRNLFGLLVAATVAGCGGPPAPAGKEKPAGTAPTRPAHDHSGWWCDEHGVPEAECSMCSKKVYRAAQANGDICDEHPDRAKSQCFVCDPALKEEFAKRYRAKEGKEPPEPVGQTAGK